MKKRINKHIDNKDFVKVYIANGEENSITHFEGIIFEQNDKLLFMNDMTDFTYDGFVVVKKSDISEIKCSDNEKFIKYIIDQEKITNNLTDKKNSLKLALKNYKDIFLQLNKMEVPVIIECKYGNDDRFLIGTILSVDDKKVRIKYFNARGEYDLKPIAVKIKDITFIRIDSPYANIFYKYAKEIE